MTQLRKLAAKRDSSSFGARDDRPLWLRHRIKNRHNYLNALILNCRDLERYEEGVAYVAALTARLFDAPFISQASFYDEHMGEGDYAKHVHAALEQYRALIPRMREMGKLDWLVHIRFSAVDYEEIKAQFDAHVARVFEELPVPEFVEVVNSIFYIENHLVVRHEEYDQLSVARGIGVEGEPGTNKFANYGFSRPSRDANDPRMQVAYIDWYQEVRQHDSLRGNFPDEVGRMWLMISSQKPFDFWCLTTYEYCARDLSAIKVSVGAAYYAMNRYRGDSEDLYQPFYEGSGMVIAEYMKPW